MRSEQLEWSGRDWRMPVWLWVGLATMFVSVLHIIIDFGVGLFDLRGPLSLSEAATLLGVALIQVWWAVSFVAGARGSASGVASAGILGAGWAALTNGFPIVYCPPVCREAWLCRYGGRWYLSGADHDSRQASGWSYNCFSRVSISVISAS